MLRANTQSRNIILLRTLVQQYSTNSNQCSTSYCIVSSENAPFHSLLPVLQDVL